MIGMDCLEPYSWRQTIVSNVTAPERMAAPKGEMNPHQQANFGGVFMY